MLLRWRFDFADTKPSKTGDWGIAHSHEPSKMAAFVNKENLLRASIEGLTVDGKIITVAECDGHDFTNFKWMAELRENDTGQYHSLVGLMIVTRNEQLMVYDNGTVHVEARADDDKNFHYEGYGR